MLIRVDSRRIAFVAIYDLLDLYWISICLLDFLRISECNIFKTMNFTERPEHGISIFTRALDLEHFAQIKFFKSVKSNIVHHLILGKRLSGVDGEIRGNVAVRVFDIHVFKETELAHNILR